MRNKTQERSKSPLAASCSRGRRSEEDAGELGRGGESERLANPLLANSSDAVRVHRPERGVGLKLTEQFPVYEVTVGSLSSSSSASA